MGNTIVCYGEIGIDRYVAVDKLPGPEISAYVREDFYNIGGGAANTAVWLAAWGLPVRLVGHELGSDIWGKYALTQLAKYPKMDTQFVRLCDGIRTPECQCIITPDGNRTFLVHWPDVIQVTALSPEMLQGASWLSLDQSGPKEPRLNAAYTAHTLSIPILVNDVLDINDPLVQLASVLIVSAGYAHAKGIPDIVELAHQLRRRSGGTVIATDGAGFVKAFTAEEDVITAIPPHVEAVDTTGAGDIFKAGFLYGLLQNWPIQQALAFGIASGVAKVQRKGATHSPATLTEVELLVDDVRFVGRKT